MSIPVVRLHRIFWVLVVAFAIYELVALVNAPSGDTISEIVWSLVNYPLVPFLFGLVCGHFFWQRQP